jgi:hypothetical protein
MKKTMYGRLALVVIMASLFLINISLYTSYTDYRIKLSGKQSCVFESCLKVDDIKVQLRDGLVTLEGKAGDAAQKDLATKLVSALHGVKGVVNNMTVEGAESKTPSKTAESLPTVDGVL